MQISSLDPGYVPGDLSLFPDAIDDDKSLYRVTNNSQTKLTQTISFNSNKIIVEDASSFPKSGIIRISSKNGEDKNAELIFYESRTKNVFKNVIRGFAGSKQSSYPLGSLVTASVMAAHNNAIRDAILNMQKKVGLNNFPDPNSLSGELKNLENRFLSPKPLFRAYPKKAPPGAKIRFQNFSESNSVRFFWDFGDGTQSVEKNPEHIYLNEGNYTVQLSVITTTGARSTASKNEYIKISESELEPFFYVKPLNENAPNYSLETAQKLVASGVDVNAKPQEFEFIDQSDGSIIQRFWIFDDGIAETQLDADIHTANHIFEKPGTYESSLIIIFESQSLKRVFLTQELKII